MNDYKELLKCLKIRSEYNRDGGFWNEGVSDSIDAAIKAIEQLVKERDELKLDLCEANGTIEYLNDKLKDFGEERDALKKKVEERCHICKYYNPSDWEWRGVRDE